MERERGFANLTFVFVAIVITFAFLFTMGYKKTAQNNPQDTPTEFYTNPEISDRSKKNSLQLKTFGFETVQRTNQCSNIPANTEPEIFVGSDPPPGDTVKAGEKIRVWVTDEWAPFIAPSEQVNPDGSIVERSGNRTAKDIGSDGKGKYLWEPAIYLTLITPDNNINGPYEGDAERGGIPHFPTFIKGDYNNNPPHAGWGSSTTIPIDSDWIDFQNGPDYAKGVKSGKLLRLTAEYVWDVSLFNPPLEPGSYRAEFIIHDGDGELAIECITIQIAPR